MGSSVDLIKRMVRWARVSRNDDDSGNFPVQQFSYHGKTGDAVMWFPYGFHANVPEDQLSLLLNVQANSEARVAFPGSPIERPKLGTAIEVVIFHPPTGSKIHFKANGDIELVTTTKVKVDAPSAEFTGNVAVIGDITAADITASGDLDVTGSATLGATVTAGGTAIGATHAHIGSPTAPTGSISNTGIPI